MESVKAAVHTVTEAVFPGINVSYRRNVIYRSDEVMSSLPLQMSLYFNIYFSPFWLLIRICTIAQKYMQLTQLYKIILITVIVVMTPVEVSRLYLGYVGNLTEKVPELAGFWLLTLLLQFPLHSLLLFHDGHIILPVEQAVDVIMMVFIVSEIILGYLSLKAIACHQANKFQQHMLRLEDMSSFQCELQPVA